MRGRFEALLYATALIGTSLAPTLAFTPISRRPALEGAVHHRHGRARSNERGTARLDMSDAREDNFLASLIKNFVQNEIDDVSMTMEAVETEDEKQQRLRVERLAEIEAGEVRRQARVAEDKFGYLFLFALQLLPLIGSDRVESVLYFFGVAVCTVYLGGRQEVIDRPERVSRENALYAPVGASLAIGGLYLLLKMGIDITSLYAIMVTVFGALAISGKWSLLQSKFRVHKTGIF
jgi:hypothetical protein